MTTTSIEPFDARLIQVLNCPLCSFMSKRITPYMNHLHDDHQERITVDIYMCSVCSLKSTHKDLLKDHASLDHTDMNATVETLTHLIANSSQPEKQIESTEKCVFCPGNVELTFETKRSHYATEHKIQDIFAFSVYQCQPESTVPVIIPTPSIGQILRVKNEPSSESVINSQSAVESDSYYSDSSPSPRLTRNQTRQPTKVTRSSINSARSSTNAAQKLVEPVAAKMKKSIPSKVVNSPSTRSKGSSSSKDRASSTSAKTKDSKPAKGNGSSKVISNSKTLDQAIHAVTSPSVAKKKKVPVKTSRRSRKLSVTSSDSDTDSNSGNNKDPNWCEDSLQVPKKTPVPPVVKNIAAVVDTQVKPPQQPAQQTPHQSALQHTGVTLVAPVEEQVKCPDCSRTFKSGASMRIHNSLTHWRMTTNDSRGPIAPLKDDEPLFECPTCLRRFMRRSGLEAHLVRTHSIPADEAQMHADSISCLVYSIDSLEPHMTRPVPSLPSQRNNKRPSEKSPPRPESKSSPPTKKCRLDSPAQTTPTSSTAGKQQKVVLQTSNPNKADNKTLDKKISVVKPIVSALTSPASSPLLKKVKLAVPKSASKPKTPTPSSKSPPKAFTARKSTGGLPRKPVEIGVRKTLPTQKQIIGYFVEKSPKQIVGTFATSEKVATPDSNGTKPRTEPAEVTEAASEQPQMKGQQINGDDLSEPEKQAFNSCAVCSKKLPDLDSFVRHMIEEHSEENRSGSNVHLFRENILNNPNESSQVTQQGS